MGIEGKTEKIRFDKAGECLRYGLGTEWESAEDIGLSGHLSAFICFFTLTGFIGRKYSERLRSVLKWRINGPSSAQMRYRLLAKTIVKELRKHLGFSDADRMFSELDHITIPGWAFDGAEYIMEMLPGIYLVGGRLYLLMESGRCHYFRSVSLGDIEELPDCRDEIEVPDMDVPNATISKSYSGIIGYEPRNMVFYLSMENTSKMYAAYHVSEKQEVYYRYKCIGLMGDTFPVVEKGSRLYVQVNGSLRLIKEMDGSECYLTEDDCIRVEPAPYGERFFMPYRLMLDGRTEEYPYDEAAGFLVGRLTEDMDELMGFGGIWRDVTGSEAGRSAYRKGSPVTLYVLYKLLDDRNLEKEGRARMYHFLMKILEAYLQPDQDILPLLYLMADASRKMSAVAEDTVISEKLYWKLSELHLAGQLGGILGDPDRLRECLLEDGREDGPPGCAGCMDDGDDITFLNDEDMAESDMVRPDSRDGDERDGGEIGCFEIRGGTKLNVLKADIQEAMVLGSSLVPPHMDLPGTVSFNLGSGVYEVRYMRLLEEQEREAVIDAFGLDGREHRFYVDFGAAEG